MTDAEVKHGIYELGVEAITEAYDNCDPKRPLFMSSRAIIGERVAEFVNESFDGLVIALHGMSRDQAKATFVNMAADYAIEKMFREVKTIHYGRTDLQP